MKINSRWVIISILLIVVIFTLFHWIRINEKSEEDRSFLRIPLSDTTHARLLFQEGKSLFDRNRFDSSLSCISKAAEIYEKDSLWDFYMDCRNYIGDGHRRMGKYDTAYALLQANIETGMRRLGEMNANTAMAINKLGLWYRDKGEYEKALDCFNRALGIRMKVLPHEHIEIGWSYFNIAMIYSALGKFNLALNLYENALDVFKDIGEESWPLAQTYGNIGSVFNITGYYDKALDYFDKSLAMRIKLFGSEHSSIALIYNSLASVYLKQGDFPKASILLNRALSIQLRLYGEMHYETAFSYYNLGFVHRGNNDHEAALKMFKKALSIRLQVYGTQHASVASAFDEIGMEWLEKNENDSAIVYFQKALKVHTDRPGAKSFMRAYELNHIGSGYLNKKEYAKALRYYNEALKINLEFYGKKHEQVSQTFSDMAQIYRKNSEYTAAIEFIEKAIDALVWEKTQDFSNIKTVNAMNLFLALVMKGDIAFELFQNKSHDRADLQKAFVSYEAALLLTDKIRREYTLQESKLRLGQSMNTITENAIQTGFALFSMTNDSSYLEKAFLFSEKNKAAVLSDVLKDEYAKSAAGIPDTLLLYESQLLSRIGSYHKKLYIEQTSANLKESKIRLLLDNIFDATAEYDRHIRYIERTFPQYYELKYRPVSISPVDIRKNLDDSTALIEYFFGNKKLFIFFAGKKNFVCREYNLDSAISNRINALRKGIEKQDIKMYTGSAFFLYEILLKNVPINGIKRLIIVPDGPLSSIPFEVLLTAPPKSDEKYTDLDYLIKSHSISYAYSSSLYLQNPRNQSGTEKNLIGFSPSIFK